MKTALYIFLGVLISLPFRIEKPVQAQLTRADVVEIIEAAYELGKRDGAEGEIYREDDLGLVRLSLSDVEERLR